MIARPRLLLPAVLVVAVLGAGVGRAVTEYSDADGGGAAGARGAAATASAGSLPRAMDASPSAARERTPGGATRRRVTAAQARAGRLSAHLLRPATLRTAPGGVPVARVGRLTGYGSRRVFAVAGLRPGWIGVRAMQRPNGRIGWLPESAVRLRPVRTTLVADLSDRELTVRVDGKARHRAPLGIGRPGSETPLGRYGVTDRLKYDRRRRVAYGCCAIALTGRQANPPPGWTGGTRLALHGTPSPGSVGRESSAGCLRMREADVRELLTLVPLGATLVVRE